MQHSPENREFSVSGWGSGASAVRCDGPGAGPSSGDSASAGLSG